MQKSRVRNLNVMRSCHLNPAYGLVRVRSGNADRWPPAGLIRQVPGRCLTQSVCPPRTTSASSSAITINGQYNAETARPRTKGPPRSPGIAATLDQSSTISTTSAVLKNSAGAIMIQPNSDAINTTVRTQATVWCLTKSVHDEQLTRRYLTQSVRTVLEQAAVWCLTKSVHDEQPPGRRLT